MLARTIIKLIVWCTYLTNLKRTNNYTRKDSSRMHTTHFSDSRKVSYRHPLDIDPRSTETPLGQRPPWQRLLDTDPPWTESPLGQRPPWTKTSPQWTENPQKEHGASDRDSPRRNMGPGSHTSGDIIQRPLVDRQTPVKILPCTKLRSRVVKMVQ